MATWTGSVEQVSQLNFHLSTFQFREFFHMVKRAYKVLPSYIASLHLFLSQLPRKITQQFGNLFGVFFQITRDFDESEGKYKLVGLVGVGFW